MTRYQFHGDYIMEVATDYNRGFVDLDRMEMVTDPEEVRDLFASHGCLELCPIEEGEE